MANYRKVYERLATRAVQQGASNIEAFVGRLADAGVPAERIEELLIEDLMTDGPIFENFFRALGGASEAAAMTSYRQGATMAIIDEDKALRDMLDAAGYDKPFAIVDAGDPDVMAAIEAASAPLIELTWVATLVNTCHLCLPLHGVTRTRAEWDELGYDPATIHPGDWRSSCRCQFVERSTFDKEQEMAPLLRVREKGSKSTVRGVSSVNLDTAINARNKAMQSEQGRATLRRMGRVNTTTMKEGVASAKGAIVGEE